MVNEQSLFQQLVGRFNVFPEMPPVSRNLLIYPFISRYLIDNSLQKDVEKCLKGSPKMYQGIPN